MPFLGDWGSIWEDAVNQIDPFTQLVEFEFLKGWSMNRRKNGSLLHTDPVKSLLSHFIPKPSSLPCSSLFISVIQSIRNHPSSYILRHRWSIRCPVSNGIKMVRVLMFVQEGMGEILQLLHLRTYQTKIIKMSFKLKT